MDTSLRWTVEDGPNVVHFTESQLYLVQNTKKCGERGYKVLFPHWEKEMM